eukprot:2890690-Pleurochrysis_carterae.AAC.1
MRDCARMLGMAKSFSWLMRARAATSLQAMFKHIVVPTFMATTRAGPSLKAPKGHGFRVDSSSASARIRLKPV